LDISQADLFQDHDPEEPMKRVSIFCLVFSFTALIAFLAPSPAGAGSGPADSVTYTKDIAPILNRNCAVCHRPGTVAPMSLLTYKEVRPWAKAIREEVIQRRMPPWHADPRYGVFENDRHLEKKDIDKIVAWVDAGAREGDLKDMPPAPKFPDEGWSIGKPDVVLSMPEEASVPAEGVVAYRFFVVPTNFTEDKYVQAAEIRKGDASVVHHVIINVREPGQGTLPPAGELRGGGFEGGGGGRQDETSAGSGNANRGSGNPDGMLIGWAPGMMPLTLKPGQAKLIKKGSVLIFQMHYTTSGVPAKDRTSVGLTFSKGPVEKRVITTAAFARGIDIPPGDPSYESHATFTFKEDGHILSFMPHMHLRGKDFQYRIVYPDGTSKVVLDVPRYDFNWQTTYILKEPLAVPKGSKIECTAHHDNSMSNKFNPDPSKEVRWGQQTWEEMMIGWFDYTLDSQNLKQETASLR
jgi:mono/diheme cytochrome c family protein